MWFLILTTLVVASTGVLGTDDICEKHGYEVCRPDTHPKFPQNEKELEETCPIFLSLLNCMNEHAIKCEKPYAEEISRDLELIEDICQKDSRLHEVIAGNLACITESIKEEGCPEDIDTTYHAYREYVEVSANASGKEVSREDQTKIFCMGLAYDVACVTDAVSRRCGNTAKEVIIELSHRVDYLDLKGDCTRNVREQIVNDIPDIQLNDDHRRALEELLLGN